ncbi:MAG: cardiolipin synthetase [Rhodobacteraceae bacterium]|nr:cardiolipin synthetase [Paracoccaceae bacterium]
MGWLETHLLVVLVGLVVTASAAIILQQRRSPQATLAWLMFLVLLPYLAIPFFLALGFRKRLQVPGIPPGPIRGEPGPDALPIERMLVRYGLGKAEGGNRFDLLADGVDAWNALVDLVRSAESSIDATLYIIGDDAVGRAFCAALAERARNGVAVRLILDSLGGLIARHPPLRELRAAGVEVRFYSPLLHGPAGGHVNLRNHRKMVIVDGTRVWSGGRNVAAEYLGPEPAENEWRDLSCLVVGPAVSGFGDVFRSDWTAARGKLAEQAGAAPVPAGNSSVQIVPAGPDVAEDPLHDALVHACHIATVRIHIVTPYFLPTPTLSEALAIAARRGVDVRILVPAKSNQRYADMARGAWLRELERCGCRICLHPAMVHAKAILADDLAFVGSANFDARSLLLNFEIMVLLSSKPDIEAVRQWLDGLLAEACEGLPPASLVRRSVEGLFRLGSPVL